MPYVFKPTIENTPFYKCSGLGWLKWERKWRRERRWELLKRLLRWQ